MTTRHEPTLASLERHLRAALRDRVRSVRIVASWKQAAHIEWEGDGEKVGDLWVEPFQRGIGWAVVHELTHYVMRHVYERQGELEEPQTEGLATAVWKRIEDSPRRYWWWRKAVRDKLKGGV